MTGTEQKPSSGILGIRHADLADKPPRRTRKGRWSEVYKELEKLPVSIEGDEEWSCIAVTLEEDPDVHRLRIAVYAYARRHGYAEKAWRIQTEKRPREDGAGTDLLIWKAKV